MHTHVPQMFEGKERRRVLIAELRTTHALQSPEQKEKRRESDALHSKQVSSEREEHKEPDQATHPPPVHTTFPC